MRFGAQSRLPGGILAAEIVGGVGSGTRGQVSWRRGVQSRRHRDAPCAERPDSPHLPDRPERPKRADVERFALMRRRLWRVVGLLGTAAVVTASCSASPTAAKHAPTTSVTQPVVAPTTTTTAASGSGNTGTGNTGTGNTGSGD